MEKMGFYWKHALENDWTEATCLIGQIRCPKLNLPSFV